MPEKRFDGMAIASFVCGICGFILFIPSILAIIFGFIGLSRIKKNKNLRGKVLAWWGIILGILPLALILIGIIWVVIRNIAAPGI